MKVFYYSNPNKNNDPKFKEHIEMAKKQFQEKKAKSLLEQQQEEETTRKVLQQAKSYLKAEAKHAWGGPAPEDEVRKRIELCLQCPGRVEELDGKTDTGGIGFCTKCGCPASQRSQLSVKLTLAGVACPLGKFNVVDGTGGTIASAVEAAKGITASVFQALQRPFKHK